MRERLAGWWKRRDIYDLLAVLLMVVFLVLIIVNVSMYPVYLDIPYHMAVTEGFQEAGGVTTWDFWDSAPAGRPHIYPPLLHVVMSLLLDVGLSLEVVATLICMIMFPLILLSLWWSMRKLFGTRAAFYSLILMAIPYAFFWQSGVTVAASLVMMLTPLIFLTLEEDRKVAALILLALCIYSHLVMGHLVALALFIYLLHRRDSWRKVLAVLVGAYLFYLPWGIVVLSNLSSFSVSEPAAGGGVVLHIFLWMLAAAGFILCYFRKKQYYLLPSYLLSMVPIVFFYSSRFWEGHAFLPVAMLGAVALDRLQESLSGLMTRRPSLSSRAGWVSAAALAVVLLLIFSLDPVLASENRAEAPAANPPQQAYGELDRQQITPYRLEITPPAAEDDALRSEIPLESPDQAPDGLENQVPYPYPGQAPAVPPGLIGGGADAEASPPGRLRDLRGGSLNLSLQPTTFFVLLGWEAPRNVAASEREVFGDETDALTSAIEEYSEAGDVVFTMDGRLGDLIYAMTGRYSMQGMFHEVQPESKPDPATDADIAVLTNSTRVGPAGGVTAAPLDEALEDGDWEEATRVGAYTIYVHEEGGSKGVETSSAALPMWAAYVLLFLAAGLLIIDVARRRPRGFPPGPPPLPQKLDRPPSPGPDNGGKALAMVPAHNEGQAIGRVVGDIRRTCPGLEVLVVDDGSRDHTGKEALEAGALVLRMESNGGVGEAVRRGLSYAYSMGYSYAVRLDGDGQHPARFIPRLLEPLRDGGADVVVGSRFLQGEGGFKTSLPRRLGRAYFATLLRWSTLRDFTDPTSGFRAYSRRAMRFLALDHPLRYPEVTSLRLLEHNRYVVREVGVEMEERHTGRSTLRWWRSLAMVLVVSSQFLTSSPHAGYGGSRHLPAMTRPSPHGINPHPADRE
ncbi:MAG: glycosyltransferase [Actinomycetota bacterium]|nr:glycosyltransferase [Actinomycetota bacterium]